MSQPVVQCSDADYDSVDVTYSWSLNDVVLQHNGTDSIDLSAYSIDSGEFLTCTVAASDGHQEVTSQTSVEIQ